MVIFTSNINILPHINNAVVYNLSSYYSGFDEANYYSGFDYKDIERLK